MITSFKNSLQKTLKNQLVAGSAVLFLGSSIASFGNYLFHLLMGRMLGPIDYGILASLISLTYLLGIPLGSLGVVVVKYVSTFRGKGELGMIAYFYSWINKKLIPLGLAGSFLLLFFSPLIASFLHFESSLLVLLMVVLNLVGVYQTVPGATLQGLLRFGLVSVLGIVQVSLKLGIAVLLAYWGGKVFGAVSAMIISALVGYSLVVFWVRRLLVKPEKEGKINGREVVKYAIPVFFSTLAFTSLYTTDVVLARHFLSAQEAGFYAALSTLGKTIVFASSPIIGVMFPLVSEHHANGRKYLNFLTLSFGLVLTVCLGISGLYFIFPGLMVRLLFGNLYLSTASYLFLFAIFLSLYSLCSLLVNFYLSIKKTKVVVLPVIAAVAQVAFIFLFHQNLSGIVWVSISLLSLLLVSLLVYFFLNYAKTKKAFAFRHCSRL